MDAGKIITVLRNPWGFTGEEIKTARLEAADTLERLKYVAEKVEAAAGNIECFDTKKKHIKVLFDEGSFTDYNCWRCKEKANEVASLVVAIHPVHTKEEALIVRLHKKCYAKLIHESPELIFSGEG